MDTEESDKLWNKFENWMFAGSSLTEEEESKIAARIKEELEKHMSSPLT